MPCVPLFFICPSSSPSRSQPLNLDSALKMSSAPASETNKPRLALRVLAFLLSIIGIALYTGTYHYGAWVYDIIVSQLSWNNIAFFKPENNKLSSTVRRSSIVLPHERSPHCDQTPYTPRLPHRPGPDIRRCSAILWHPWRRWVLSIQI